MNSVVARTVQQHCVECDAQPDPELRPRTELEKYIDDRVELKQLIEEVRCLTSLHIAPVDICAPGRRSPQGLGGKREGESS